MSDDVREHFESARIPGLALDPQAVLARARRRRRTRRIIQGGAVTAGLATAAIVFAAIGLRATPISQGLVPATTSTTEPTSPTPTTVTAIPTVYATPTPPTVTPSGTTSSAAPSVTRRPSSRPSTTKPAAPTPTRARVSGQLGERALFSMGFSSHGDRAWAEDAADGNRVVRFEQATDANQATWLPNVQMTVPSSGVGKLQYGTRPPSGVAYLVTPYRPKTLTLTSRSGASKPVEFLSTVQLPGTSWFALIIPAADYTTPFSTQVSSVSWSDDVGNVYTVAAPAG